MKVQAHSSLELLLEYSQICRMPMLYFKNMLFDIISPVVTSSSKLIDLIESSSDSVFHAFSYLLVVFPDLEISVTLFHSFSSLNLVLIIVFFFNIGISFVGISFSFYLAGISCKAFSLFIDLPRSLMS